MEYITEILGIEVLRKKWNDNKKLPYFLIDEYSFETVILDNTECLFVKPKNDIAIINTLKKHLIAIKKMCNLPIVLELDKISRQKCKSFIENRISFVVNEKQIYLPFMGISLKECFDSEQYQENNFDVLLPSAQMILFSIIYQKCKATYLIEYAKKYGLSAMSVTRAAKQLTGLGLLKIKQEGRMKILYSELSTKELYERSKPYFTNPIRKTAYIDKNQIASSMFFSGLTALSEISMINRPSLEVYGTIMPIKDVECSEVLFDSEKQCKIEFWKYNPTILSGNNYADVLSLSVCFKKEADERVQTEIGKLLKEKVW